MIPERRTTLTDYLAELQSKGRIVFAAEEAVETLGTNRGAFLDASQRLQKRGQLLSPRKGFYVIVPPQFATWGAPPPSWYIDPLMRQEKQPYYVGLLKAAELHGATHQAVMEFQVVTGKRMPRIRAGRNLIVFYYRKEMATISDGVEDIKTDTGRMKVSSPALTALDLIRYPPMVIAGTNALASRLWSKIRMGRSALGIQARPVSTARDTGTAGKTLMTAFWP